MGMSSTLYEGPTGIDIDCASRSALSSSPCSTTVNSAGPAQPHTSTAQHSGDYVGRLAAIRTRMLYEHPTSVTAISYTCLDRHNSQIEQCPLYGSLQLWKLIDTSSGAHTRLHIMALLGPLEVGQVRVR